MYTFLCAKRAVSLTFLRNIFHAGHVCINMYMHIGTDTPQC